MSVTLTNVGGIFNIIAGATVVLAANNYINYDNSTGVLSSSTTLPVDNDLFDYTSAYHLFNSKNLLLNIYDFKGNTIVYGAGGTGAVVDSLFQHNTNSALGSPSFKNLNILVEVTRSNEEGYLLGNSTGDGIFNFIDNVHVVTNIATTTPIIVGLAGNDFDDGSITNCSVTYTTGSERPTFFEFIGGMAGQNCASGTVLSSFVYIANCFTTPHIGSDCGGIVGSISARSIAAGTINKMHIFSCYSTGDIGNNSGGICGPDCSTIITAGVGSIVTIESCYSTGDTVGIDAGGICGDSAALVNVASSTAVLNILSCYSTGVQLATTCGGLCGSSAGTETSGTTSIVVNGCYALGGADPVDNFATGILFGTGTTLASVASTNNSFSLVMFGDVSTDGRELLSVVQALTSYSDTLRCVFTGDETVPILNSFLDCDIWEKDPSCVNVYAPTLGFCGCPLIETDGIEWPQTYPGNEVVFLGTNSVSTRMCESSGVWGSITTVGCHPTGTSGYITAISITSVLLFIAIMTIIVMLVA